MKKLAKLLINKEKVIGKEELINLKGGDYIMHFVSCRLDDNTHCWEGEIPKCDSDWVESICSYYCPGWANAICV